jgi:hypothetical protein
VRELDEHQSQIIASLMRDAPSSVAMQALAGRGATMVDSAQGTLDVAHDPHMSREVLLAMGQSKDPYVRAVIAARADCPLGLLVALADDHVVEVRLAVAENVNAIPSVLEVLARDRHVAVVLKVAANPSLPHTALVALARDKHRNVRKVATAGLLSRTKPRLASPDQVSAERRDRVFEDALFARRVAPEALAPLQPTGAAAARGAPHLY